MKTIRAGALYVFFAAIVCGSLCFGSSARAEWKTLREARENEPDGIVQLDVNQEIKGIRITGQSELIWIWELSVKVGNQMLSLDEYTQLGKGEKLSPIIPNAPRQVARIVIKHGDGSFRVEVDAVQAKPAARQKITEGSGSIALGGRWEAFGKNKKIADCEIIQKGYLLEFVVQLPGRPELRAPGRFVDSETTRADGWMSSTAKIREGGKRLEWDNGGYWQRTSAPAAPPNSPGADMAALKQQKATAGEVAPFPDEAAAMAEYNARPSAASLRKISDIRFQHATQLLNEYNATSNPAAMEKAIDYAQAILEYDPRHVRTHLLLGTLAFQSALNGAPTEALAEEHLQDVLEFDPKNGQARQLLGLVYMNQALYDPGLEQFEQLLRADASFVTGENVSVMCTAYQRDEQQARGVRFFRNLAAANPGKADVQMGLAMMYLNVGGISEASDLLRRMANDANIPAGLRETAQACLADLAGKEEQP